MKNKLRHLNDHLFAQLERLSEEDIDADRIEQECKRADAIVALSDQILGGAKIHLTAAKLIADHGDRCAKMLPMIGDQGEPEQPRLNGQAPSGQTPAAGRTSHGAPPN